MKRFTGNLLSTLSLVLGLFMLFTPISFAADFYLHSTTTDNINNSAPTATTTKFKDSPAVNRTNYQQIGIWSAGPFSLPMQLDSLASLITWIGLKNSDDQGTYFDLKAEIRKNGIVIATGETKNIQGVTRNPSLAKEVAVAFGAIFDSQFAASDVLSIRILAKVADSGGHNNAVGLRLYYDAVSRPSRFGAAFGAAAPAKLVVTSVNGGLNPVAGTPFSVTVQSQDGGGTPTSVVTATDVSLSLKTGPGALGGTLSGMIAAGTNQVTISGVTYTKAESGVVITATRTSGDSLTAGDSPPFTVEPGAASTLTFFTQPGNATAGSAIGGPPTVAVQDGLGNTVTTSTIYITVALGTNPGGSTLSGYTTLYTSAGVATFNDLSLNKAGAGYTLTASSPELTSATSSPFNIAAGAAVALAFTTQPENASVGSNISGPPTVTVRDNFGNAVTSSTASITIGIGANPGGGTLSGVTTKSASNGMAIFNDLSINQARTAYTLTATATGISSATSNSFDITAAVTGQLVFTSEPINTVAGNAIGGPPSVTVQDSYGNIITSFSGSITLALGTNPGGSTLSGTTTVNAEAGSATFTDLSLNKSATGYRLTASSAGVASATSGSFNISAGSGAALAFVTQPGNVMVGSNISGPPTVLVRDSFGNVATSSTASVTVTIGTNPVGATLSGTTTRNLANGVASFSNLRINQIGTGYTFTAAATGMTGASSNAFNITAPTASLTAIPTTVPVGDPFTVTWSQIPNPTNRDWIGLYSVGANDGGYLDYVYTGCTQSPTVAAASGACSFPIPSWRVPGTYEFRLFSNDTFDLLAMGSTVTLTAPSNLNKLVVIVGQNVAAGTPGFSITVQSQTPSGAPANVATDTAISVTLTVGSGILSGTLNGTILAGTNQAVIGPITYSKAENSVVLTASRTSGDDLRAAASLPFSVSPGAPAKLVFTTQPGNATVGNTIPGPPTLVVQDNAGNVVSSTTTAISIALSANPGGATLDDNLTVTYASSVSFPALIVNQVGNGYTLIASSPGLQSATSNPFNVSLPGGGGTIAGIITRVSGGATISGALVEAFEGITLRGTAVTNSSGDYSITGLATGSYTVRASFTGLVPQMLNNVRVISGSTTNVSLSLNFGIAVQTPASGATVNDFRALVTGNFDRSLAPEVGITVNGFVAIQDGDEFATLVPIDSQTTTLTAVLKDAAGNFLAGDTVPITLQIPSSEAVLSFRPFPAIALATQTVSFTLTSLNETSQIELDGNGDGTIDFIGSTLEGVSVTFAEPGIYFPTVSVTDTTNAVYADSAIVQVLDIAQLDAQLRAKWEGMKNALRGGDTATAASYIVSNKRASYQAVFNNLNISFSSIDQIVGDITYQGVKGFDIEYEMVMDDGLDGIVSYMVLFSLDTDGNWRVSFF